MFRNRRPRWPLFVGGAAIIGGVFLLACLQGCAVGFTEPDNTGHRAVVWGWDAGAVAAQGGQVGAWLASVIGDPAIVLPALAGTGGLGAIAIGLVRGWANAKANAASERAANTAHDEAWDESERRTLAMARLGVAPRFDPHAVPLAPLGVPPASGGGAA